MKEWKKILFYAIIPAIIAGTFAVGPKLYDEFNEPKAVLEYKISKGPMLKDEKADKSIYAIEVINNGKKPLSSIYASIKTKGSIEAINTYESTGLSPVVISNPPSVSVETLHPNEAFTISLMLVTTKGENALDFVLRSKEALGGAFKPTDTKKMKTLDRFSAIATSISVFLMAFVFLTRARKGKPIISVISHKSDIIYYIAVKIGLSNIVNKYGINEGKVTYLRFGDMLFSIANAGDSEDKRKAILALKTMLLNIDMAEVSKNMIIRNLKSIEGDDYSEEEISLLIENNDNTSDLGKQRDRIDSYIENPSMFLTDFDTSEVT